MRSLRHLIECVAVALVATAPCAAPALAAWPDDPVMNLPVVTEQGEQDAPLVVPDGAGGAIIVWQDFRSGGTSDLYAQRVSADGVAQWSAGGVPVCTAPGFQTLPQVVPDGAGGIVLAWTDYRSGGGDIYVQRLDASGAQLWTPNGLPICDDPEAQLGAAASSDGAGGIIVVWEDFRHEAAGDLYVQRVSSSGVPMWALNGTPVCLAAGTQTGVSITGSAQGGAIVTWRDQRSGFDGDIYAQRVSGGAAQWTTDGVAVCTASGGQFDPRAVSDGAGGAIVAWSDERSGGAADIYAQRVNQNGSMQWTGNGVLVCGAPVFQLFPVIVSDGAGGAIIAWEDYRSASSIDIYAQRVSGIGEILWQLDGVEVCVVPAGKSVPAIAADGLGGVIIAWQDQRSLGPEGAQWTAAGATPGDDIYAQRLHANGQRMWPSTGVAVSVASDIQQSPRLTSNASGGATVVWYDLRSGEGDVYAQHVMPTGALGGTVSADPSPVAPRVMLSPPMPNPARGSTQFHLRLPQAAPVTLDLFDAAGRHVRALASGWMPAGHHTIHVPIADAGGSTLAPGVYLVRLRAAHARAATRLIVRP